MMFQCHWKLIHVPWKEPNVRPFLFVSPLLVQLLLVFMSSGRDDVRDLRALVLLYALPMTQLDVRRDGLSCSENVPGGFRAAEYFRLFLQGMDPETSDVLEVGHMTVLVLSLELTAAMHAV